MASITLEQATDTFRKRFALSGELTKSGGRYIPGGYSRSSFNFGPHAIFIDSGHGAKLESVEGHELLDLNNNFTVNMLGHAHPAITRALSDAIPQGISFGNPGRYEEPLAAMLVERIPSVEKVQFSCSATESCMSAVRVARAYTGKTKIAKFEGGYHGFSDVLHVSSHSEADDDAGPDNAPIPVADSGGIPDHDVAAIVVLVQNDRESSERILRANAKDVACLILELQSGSGGLVALERDFVAFLRELTAELGILLIFDETISLRAGYHGAQGMYGVTPDLTVMGKLIGGGMPLGALGGKAEIMAALETGDVTISGTHHGHKLALAAGAACLNELDEQAFETLNAHAKRITRELNEFAARRNSAFQIFGNGSSHLAYTYTQEVGQKVQNHRDYWYKVDANKVQIISLELANRGFFPVHRGEFSLSLPMTEADIDGFIATMEEIVIDLES